MTSQRNNHQGRIRFDTLLRDPRHYRGDCRLLRSAIRRGWLDDAGPEVWMPLLTRLREARQERERWGWPSGRHSRAAIAEVRVSVELSGWLIDHLTG